MILAVTHFEVKQEKIKDLHGKWDVLVEEALKEKALHKALLLMSPERKCMAIGIWDDYEKAKAWGSSPTYQNFVKVMQEFIVGKPERHVYSVSRGDLSGILEAKKAA